MTATRPIPTRCRHRPEPKSAPFNSGWHLVRRLALLHTSDVPLALFPSREERQHIAVLRRHSLISGGKGQVVRMHALTNLVLRKCLMDEYKSEGLAAVLGSLGKGMAPFERTDTHSFKVGRQYAFHVNTALSHVDWPISEFPGGPVAALAASLLGFQAADFFAFVACLFPDALALYLRTLDILLAVRGKQHLHVAWVYSAMAHVHYQQGRFDESLTLFEESEAALPCVDTSDKEIRTGALPAQPPWAKRWFL